MGETPEGIWIYWIEPEDMKDDFVLPAQVRAELYRVDNALTNEGQRLVSDTLSVQGSRISSRSGNQKITECKMRDKGE